jgi:hypothetical protein
VGAGLGAVVGTGQAQAHIGAAEAEVDLEIQVGAGRLVGGTAGGGERGRDLPQLMEVVAGARPAAQVELEESGLGDAVHGASVAGLAASAAL